MKKEFQYNDTPLPWHVWGCMAIAFLIPFAKKFVPGFIGLLLIYVIIDVLRKRRIQKPLHILPLVLLLAIFAMHLLGLAWSQHPHEGLNETGIKLSFFAFPLIAWLMPSINKYQFQLIVMSFVWGSIAFIFLAFGVGIYRSTLHHDIAYLTYQQLGIFLHPTYAATYQAMAFFILMNNAAQKEYLLYKRWLHFTAAAMMLIFISMLASKAGLLAAFISIVMTLWVYIRSKQPAAKIFAVATASIAVLVLSTLIAPGALVRVDAAMSDIEAQQTPSTVVVEAKSSTQLRFVTWHAAWAILKENPAGVGTGDSESALVTKYIEMDEPYAAEKLLNAHNQFLQAGTEHGWIGLLLLLLTIGVVALGAFRIIDALMINFIILCGMNFLFESFLEVQAGIVFFCFWIAVHAATEKK